MPASNSKSKVILRSTCCFAEDGKEMYKDLQRTCTIVQHSPVHRLLQVYCKVMLNDCKPTGSLPKKGNKQKNMIKKKTNQHRHKQVGKIDVYNSIMSRLWSKEKSQCPTCFKPMKSEIAVKRTSH